MEKKKNLLVTVISVINTIIIVCGLVFEIIGYEFAIEIALLISCISTVVEKIINRNTKDKEFKMCLFATVLWILIFVLEVFI